jgi:2-hydroxy-3-keto-5-methylthiopentenyl-1-phosphate phosphatase
VVERRKGWSLLSDFDGTITERDMCLALLEEYAEGDWQALDLAYDEGRISLEECLVGQVGMFASPREDLAAYARRKARVRPGFADLVVFCQQRGVGFGIVSAGLDFYIDTILEREGLAGLDAVYIRTASQAGRMSVVLPLAGYPVQEGIRDFKEAVVRQRQAEGLRVAFVGDGSTDFAAARQADHVFARARLLAMCQNEGIPHTPFEDFHEVKKGLSRLLSEAGS